MLIGTSLTNLYQVALHGVSPRLQIAPPEIRGWQDRFELDYEHNKIEVTRDFLQGLLRALQYESAEDLVDNALRSAGIELL